MARPELPGAAVPIQPPVSPFRWAARTRFSSLLPKCSFIFRMVVVYWSWNCESCPEIKYFSLFLRTALLFQLIPARGRKQVDILIILHSRIDFNLSPQGDGNRIDWMRCLLLLTFQLIPARGRKHPQLPIPTTEMFRFQLIPARGRKLFSLCAETLFFGFQLIPAKPSQALRASSPEGRAFPAATYLVLSSPFRGSWHGVSRD